MKSLQAKRLGGRRRNCCTIAVGPSEPLRRQCCGSFIPALLPGAGCRLRVSNCSDFGRGDYIATFFPLDASREWFTAKELAALLGRTDQFVRDMVDNGRIFGHTLRGRGVSGRKVYQIHRSAVELYLLETANFIPSDYVHRIFSMAVRLPRAEREKLRVML